MGNVSVNNFELLQMKIEATKNDISQDYDLSSSEGILQANEELLGCFLDMNYKDIMYVKTQLFKLT